MKRKHIIVVLSLILFALLMSKPLRYKSLENSPLVYRYQDRWTGLQWVKEYHDTGTNRTPAKYYDNPPEEFQTDVVLKELTRYKRIEDIASWTWYVVLIADAALIIYLLTSSESNNQSKGRKINNEKSI